MGATSSPDCFCAEGSVPWCPVCVVGVATQMRYDHPETLSISMLRRRIPGITGYMAALLVEATKKMLVDSVPMKARRNGRRYVDQK